MKKLFACLALLLALSAPDAQAHSYQQGDIRIGHVWTRETPGGMTTAAIYMPLLNTGAAEDSLVSASSAEAASIMIHQNTRVNGISKMTMLDSVALEPNKPVSFQPTGLHLMVVGLKHPLKAGTMFPLTLTFAKAGSINVEAVVEPLNATATHDH